ncbi:MAG: LPXTG cell wall anchor domain-containing protein [Eubacteriales bacterium]
MDLHSLLFHMQAALLHDITDTGSTIAPSTGDLDMMIILAVILIAGFLIFILVKSKKKNR